ncbi:MAG: putative lipid II flippase FtsW [Rubricella sp.]
MTDIVDFAPVEVQREPILARWWRTVDRVSLGAVLILVLIGLLLGHAASPPLAERNGLEPFHYVIRQAIFAGVGLAAIVVISAMPLRWVRRCAILGFVGAFVALCLLPLFGTDYGKGAVRWFSLGFMSLQPSEFLKPGFAVFAAWLMAGTLDRDGPPGRLLSFAAMVIICLILALQPDFGQASLVFGAWMVMAFIGGLPMWVILLLTGAAGLAGTIAYNASEHVARRIDSFFHPVIEPTSQLGYALTAIQDGGLFGVGIGAGEVKWRLPDAHTDYIIAVAAEEYGLTAILILIALYLTIVLRALLRLQREKDAFARIAGAGLAALLAMQAFINLGVSARLLPEKGMTLPFVSYGGSSMLAAGITVGILLALTRTRPQDDLGDVIEGARL